MTTIKPTDEHLFPLELSKAKEGVVLRIGHAMTVVDPTRLVKEATIIATDIKLEKMICTDKAQHTG